MKREEIEEKIQELIDGRLSENEAREVKHLVEKDEYLRLYYKTLQEVDAELHHIETALPSDSFTDRVMNRLHESGSKSFDIKSLWIFIGILVVVILGVLYAPQAQFNVPNISPVSQEIPMTDNLKVNLPGIDLPSSELLLNGFYFALLFLALLYLDRAILKPLFRDRKYSL